MVWTFLLSNRFLIHSFFKDVLIAIRFLMKTPERWRALPRRALFVSILAQKSSKDVMTSWRHDVVPWRYVTSWCHAVTSHDVRCHDKLALCNSPIWNFGNHVFQPGDLDLWPMTLTFELIWDIIKVNASTKFRVCTSNGSAVRALTDRQTHTHTQTGPILYPRPLTREGIMSVNKFCTHY